MSDKSTSLSGKESLGKVDATIGTLLPPDIENGSVQMQVGDTQLLEQIGYKQEFRREFTRWSTLSYAISVMGVLGSVPATIATPLASGGLATPVWCWFADTFFAMSIALSVAELVSAYPTAGGMTAGVASVAYSVGQMMLAMVAMGSGFDEETGTFGYSPTAEHTVATSIGCLVLMGIICSFPTLWLHKVFMWFAPINILASIAMCIALLVLTPDKHAAADVFGQVTDGSGWNSKGFGFFIGFLSVAWTMTDYDATKHISEETQDAAIRGPVVITQAVLVSGVIGLMLNITFGFCAGDLSETLASGTGNPVAQIIFNGVGSRGGIALWVWVVLIQFCTGCSAMLADTRMCYAFSRDGALPYSYLFSKVNKKTRTPVNSVWLVVILCCLLNLIALGSPQTINSIFGITAPALDCSYMAVVALRLYYGNHLKTKNIRKGPFTLGRYQKPINFIAIVWTAFITIILFFPTAYPVTTLNMNYAVVVAAGLGVFALSWWWLGARRTYIGPKVD
ncbi:hypothetical protein V502_10350 [Pseudogymnoascus sp. VKM F-4520 (FW-2644)]|nr:hypothetical protein V502_10350 [Pseudogymnoascus sp. VKM F-4520 (FW-2644)]